MEDRKIRMIADPGHDAKDPSPNAVDTMSIRWALTLPI